MKRTKISLLVMACAAVLTQSCRKQEPVYKTDLSPAKKVNGPIGGEMSGVLPNGSYRFVSYATYQNNTHKSIGIVGASMSGGAKTELRTFETNKAQEWRINNIGGNDYNIININSGQALDLPGGLATNGVQLQQWGINGNIAQVWQIVDIGGGVYQIKSKVNTSKGVNVASGSTANGAQVQLNVLTNNNSKFYVYRVAYKDKQATDWFMNRTSGFTAGDGGYTVPLNDGRVLWTFGDSFIDGYNSSDGTVPCIFSVNNQAILQNANNWNWTQATTIYDASTPSYRTLWKTGSSSWTNFYWPVAGVHLGDTAYVYGSGVEIVGGNFQSTGADRLFKMKTSSISTVSGSKALQNFNGINFGLGFVKDADGYVYVYGQKPNFLGCDVYVGRFLQSNPNGPWQFYKGPTDAPANWVSDVTQAVVVGTGESRNVNVCKINSKYIITCFDVTFDCDDGKNIYTATSSNRVGPFSARKAIYAIDDRYNGHSPRFYSTVMHPEHINANNEVLVTYSINGYPGCVTECVGGRMIRANYTLRGIRVPLKLIDSGL